MKPKILNKMKSYFYLVLGDRIYKLCWISFVRDGGFSVGMDRHSRPICEIGSAIRQEGCFDQHTPHMQKAEIIASQIRDAHITFHPPRIMHKNGIAQIRAGQQTLARWPLGWYPVRTALPVLYLYSGSISTLQRVERPQRNGFFLPFAQNVKNIEMRVVTLPNPLQVATLRLHPHWDVVGRAPKYHLLCRARPTKVAESGVYVITDQ